MPYNQRRHSRLQVGWTQRSSLVLRALKLIER